LHEDEHVLQLDETFWQGIQCRRRMVARRGARRIRGLVKGKLKPALSTICTICRCGWEPPPLYILAAAKNILRRGLCHVIQLERVTGSGNGRMTETVMQKKCFCVALKSSISEEHSF
jgi:hypothetical protein